MFCSSITEEGFVSSGGISIVVEVINYVSVSTSSESLRLVVFETGSQKFVVGGGCYYRPWSWPVDDDIQTLFVAVLLI